MKTSHWSEKYIGIPYKKKQNCAWFVNYVLKNEFNKSCNFPEIHEHKRVIDESLLIDKLISDFADDVSAEDLRDGDGVLMRYSGSLNWHLGIYFEDNFGKKKVLHSDSDFGGSVAHRFYDLSLVGITVVGFYRFY